MGRRKKQTNQTLTAPAYSGFYGKPKDVHYDQPTLKALRDKKKEQLYIKNPNDMKSEGFERLVFLSFKERKYKNPKPKLVYNVDYDFGSGELYLQTGRYIGFLNVGGVRIEIDTGYGSALLSRMLNFANNIYVNSDLKDLRNRKANKLSTLLGFLFLSSFKAAFAMGLPSEYTTVHERGFNVKGKFDVKKYIQKDMFMEGKLSYSYRQREYVQDIIDVLYLAFDKLEKDSEFEVGEWGKYYRRLKQLYSGRKNPPHDMLRRLEGHRSLNNPMFSRYKDALRYARLILETDDIIPNDDSSDGFSGVLADVSQLWEIYLEKLLKFHLEDKGYEVTAQEELELYKGRFYARHNYPDLVIRKDGTPVAVLDAKFKTMKFRGTYEDKYGEGDVDRADMFQIQSYAGYYNMKYKEAPLKLCSLVYPAKDPPENKETDSELYGLSPEETSTKFSVGYIVIGDNFNGEDLVAEEKRFLGRIDDLLGIPKSEQTPDEKN